MSSLKIKNALGEWVEIPMLKGDKGDKGIQGDKGTGISSAVLNFDYTLTITFTDGTSYTTPSIRGEKGIKGDVGNGIASTVLNNDYTLTINFTDGTQYTTPPIRGKQGEQGIQGQKGDKGDTGETGATPNLTIGTVETLEPTQPATATITGTAENPVLNLGIPHGAKGDTGEVTQAEFDELSGKVTSIKSGLNTIGVLTETVDFSKYDVINGTIQSSGIWGSINSDSYQSALITDIPIKMTVKAKADKNTYISFFAQKPSQPQTTYHQIYFCDGETGRHMIAMGTEETFVPPSDCKCIVVTVKSGVDYTPTIIGMFVTGGMLGKLKADITTNIEDIAVLKTSTLDAEYTKAEATNKFTVVQTKLTHVWRGFSYESVQTASADASLIEIPCTGYSKINYPVFVTSQDLGSIFLDKNNIVIGGNANKTVETGGYAEIDVPSDAVMFILNTTPSLDSYDWSVKLFKPNIIEINEKIKELQNKPSVFADENRNMCLAGIKTDILTDKIPYHRGFLFHKLQNNDGSLWYGTDFRNISKIGNVSFNPNSMRFAISPKDGRIIAAQRDTRNGIYVWDGKTETHVTGFTLEPMAWLYNSGVDFINDGTDEYCIFAEYKGGAPFDSFNVWRGKYPYTSVSDWEIVLTQTPTDITHFHMIRRDPWTDILYLTSGDDSAKCKWWYSTDKGATWTLLTTGGTSGYEEHICRCINFIFTADFIYWATDKGTNHCLNRVSRDANEIIDVSSREKLCDLPSSVATNSICYVESPHGIFMYDRIDIGYTADYGKPVPMSFWDIDKAELTTPFIIPLTVSDWGGSRGKCYVNYTNGKQPMPAMGFSLDTPCIFDLVCDTPARIGTIAYEVGAKTIHTIDY